MEIKAFAAVLVVVVAELTAMICAGTFTQMPVLFWGHIVAMSICWFLMVTGSLLYTISPGAGSEPARKKARIAHAIVQVLASIAGVVGYAAIFANHAKMGQSQFGFDAGNPQAKTAHALMGYVVLALMVWQVVKGFQKFYGLTYMKFKLIASTKGHALQGRVILLCAGANAALVLTALPVTGTLFWLLEVGFLGATCVAAALAGGTAAAAREPLIGVEETSYKQLSSDGTVE